MPAFAPTAEQEHIVNLFRDGNTLKVRAGAGTGKTSTLLLLADVLAEQQRLGLYLAFNRSIANEAGSKFNRRVVTAKTAHALARKGVLNTRHAPLIDKLNAKRVPFWVTRDDLGIPGASINTITGPRRLSAGLIAKHAMRTVDEFCKTADTEIGPEHVPTMPGLDWFGRRTNHRALVDIVLPYAKRVWRDVLDPCGNSVSFEHGHYLKLWAMERPRIGIPGAALFIDEAQDISKVMAAVFDDQDHLQKVVVGDSAQSIYRFTGAIDYMSETDGVEGRLTQSWRFGPQIADHANLLLDELGDDMRVTGNPGLDSHVETGVALADAILTRSNASALIHVMAAQKAGRPVCLMGDTKQSLIFLDGAEKLMNDKRVTSGDLEAFETWAQVVEYAEDAPGASDWKVLVGLIEEHGIDDVRNALSTTVAEKHAEVLVSTAHKSKGREWGTVRLDDSIGDAVEEARESVRPGAAANLRDELMLGYVAVTRAQNVLDPGKLFDDTPARTFA